jgi:transcriptional regulator with XRE-family HTH domain
MARVDEQIRRARRESGLSQEVLAERIGVPPAALHRYEEGAQISSRHLELIAVATGKPMSFFLDGTGSASQNGPGIGGRIRAALAWLSEPAGVDPEVDAVLAEVAARERSLAARERAVAALEAELEGRAAQLERLQKDLEAQERVTTAARAGREHEEDRPPAVAAERGFNLDALEHTLDERAAEFPEQADEWRAYVVFLREFVHADGELPATFNTLVREVFRDLLAKPEAD